MSNGTVVGVGVANEGLELIRLGVVDDHPVFRLGLRKAFERHRDVTVVWDVGDATRLVETVAAEPVDVVLMDLQLSTGPDGLTATRSLLRLHPSVKVIVLTASLELESVVTARKAGARGYIAKDMTPPDMVAAIKGLAAPGTRVAVFSSGLLAAGTRSGVNWSAIRGLTAREKQVLDELRAGSTNREIAVRLGVSVTTVNKHVQKVLKKLNVKNRAQAVARFNGEFSRGEGQGMSRVSIS